MLCKGAWASPSLRLTAAEGLGLAFKEEVVRLPPTTVFGLGVFVPLDRWGWYAEAGVSTPHTTFAPSFRAITGPGFIISGPWTLSFSVLGQYTPSYDGKKDIIIVGVSGAPGVKVTEQITISLVVGTARALGDGTMSVSLSPKLSFTLP
jgi:hypothetical protein